MVHNKGQGSSNPFFVAYVMLALLGSPVFSAGEAFGYELSNDDSLSSGRYYSSTGHTVDWLAGSILTIKKAAGFPGSLLRNRLLRVWAFAGATAAALCLAGANLKILRNDRIPVIKTLILLKLRI